MLLAENRKLEFILRDAVPLHLILLRSVPYLGIADRRVRRKIGELIISTHNERDFIENMPLRVETAVTIAQGDAVLLLKLCFPGDLLFQLLLEIGKALAR